MVELNLDSDFHCISIRFQDETDLTFVIDPALTFRADYSRWKGGNRRCSSAGRSYAAEGM